MTFTVAAFLSVFWGRKLESDREIEGLLRHLNSKRDTSNVAWSGPEILFDTQDGLNRSLRITNPVLYANLVGHEPPARFGQGNAIATWVNHVVVAVFDGKSEIELPPL